ncbi:MAG: bifunctional UDP-sugar hydrolase/5'-nucleotidase [Bacteroidales bacterium]
MKKTISLIIAILVTIYIQGQNVNKDLPDNQIEIVILHTNDIHAQIDNFGRLAFVTDSIRKLHKNVFLLSAGDLFSGNPMVDMSPEKGFAVIDLMNRTGFNASALGNHEFDYGQEVLKKRLGEASFPFLCANIKDKKHILVNILPSIKLKLPDNTNLFIFSVLDNSANGIPETHPSKVKGLTFNDPIKTAKKTIKKAGKQDLILALTHLGIQNDTLLADDLPQIDLIVGGHSHTYIDSIYIRNGVMIEQVGARLRNLGEIKLLVKDGQILNKSYKIINLRGKANINQEIDELVKKYNNNEMLQEVLGQAEQKITGSEELGCFYTDALRSTFNFDIAFQNSGGIRINEIPKGNITLETIYRMDPFGNYLVSVNLTTKEIRSLIESTSREGKINLRVSGMQYRLVMENNKLKQIDLMDYDGNPLDESKIYKVGMNDYILSTFKFQHQDKGSSLGVTTAEVIIGYLKKTGKIDYSGVVRTFIKNQ